MCCIPRCCNTSFMFPPIMPFAPIAPAFPFWSGCWGPKNFASGLGFGAGVAVTGFLLNKLC